MNFVTHRNRIERQMILYIEFLPYCENNKQPFKLMDEIQNLKMKIQQIDRLTMSKVSEDVIYRTVKCESKNFRDS